MPVRIKNYDLAKSHSVNNTSFERSPTKHCLIVAITQYTIAAHPHNGFFSINQPSIIDVGLQGHSLIIGFLHYIVIFISSGSSIHSSSNTTAPTSTHRHTTPNPPSHTPHPNYTHTSIPPPRRRTERTRAPTRRRRHFTVGNSHGGGGTFEECT